MSYEDVIQQVINEQLNPVEDSKEKHQAELKKNTDAFQSMSGNASVQMMVWLLGIMYSGMYSDDISSLLPASGDQGSTVIGVQEDKIREVGAQKAVTNAYTSVLSDAQSAFNNPGDASGMQKVKDDLKSLKENLGNMPKGCPFDGASKDAISGACDKLTGYLDQIGDKGKWTSLQDLYDHASDPKDTTGAASMLKNFSDQFSTISTTTQTVSNTLSTNMQMVNADYQQYLGIFNSLMQSLLQLASDTVKQQGT